MNVTREARILFAGIRDNTSPVHNMLQEDALYRISLANQYFKALAKIDRVRYQGAADRFNSLYSQLVKIQRSLMSIDDIANELSEYTDADAEAAEELLQKYGVSDDDTLNLNKDPNAYYSNLASMMKRA